MIYNLDYIGIFLSLLRAFLLAKKRFFAVKFSVFVDLFWVIICAMSDVWSLVILNLIYVILDIRTIINWNNGE